jgi:hypothetical protein
MCRECHSLWHDPTQLTAARAQFPPTQGWPKDGGRWASQAEISLRGWLDLIAGALVAIGRADP